MAERSTRLLLLRALGAALCVVGCSNVEVEPGPATSPGTLGTGTGGTDTDTDTENCPIGDEDCPCTETSGCNGSLVCIQDVCVDPNMECPIGGEGCPCTAGGACDPGLTCLSEVCVDAG